MNVPTTGAACLECGRKYNNEEVSRIINDILIVTDIEKELLDAIKKATDKGHRVEIERGRDGYKVLEVEKKVVWKEKNAPTFK